MASEKHTPQAENEQLKERLQELQDTLDAIRNGEVDALVHGDGLFSLESAESASNRFMRSGLSVSCQAVRSCRARSCTAVCNRGL